MYGFIYQPGTKIPPDIIILQDTVRLVNVYNEENLINPITNINKRIRFCSLPQQLLYRSNYVTFYVT